MTGYKIYDTSWRKSSEELFEDYNDAVAYALEMLPSQHIPYLICDAEDNKATAIVFEDNVWKP